MTEGRAEGRYSALEQNREPYLRRARQAAELTIPSLIPPQGFNGSSDLYQPYQSVGSQGVRNLSAKLTTTVLSSNTPFFRLFPEEDVLEQIEQEQGAEARAAVTKKLSKYERRVMRQIEESGDRVVVDAGMQQLITGGNVLLDVTKPKLRYHKLDSYVVVRDPRGRLIELVLKETTTKNALPEELRSMAPQDSESDQKNVSIFTHIELKKGMYHSYQEIGGKAVKGSMAKYKEAKLPYLPLRLTRVDGEDYGRGFVEEMIGDLSSLEALSTAIVEGAAAAAKVIFLVNPNGTTRVKTLLDTPNAGFAEGNADDVTVLNMEKQGDFAIAEKMMATLEARLSQAFLLRSSVPREAERVTAEEIRYLAEELDTSLSGLYSILSVEFQLPFVNLKIEALVREGDLPRLPEGVVDPVVITGLEALGRGQDLQKLDVFLRGLQETFGPEAVSREISLKNYATRRAAALGIDTEGLFKSEEQKAQEQQQHQMAQLLEKGGPGAIQEAMKQYGNAAQAAPSGQGGG